jgi:hypothetical protein
VNTQRVSQSELLYDWRFTANQFVLMTSPLRLMTSNFIIQLNTCSYGPYVTLSLTRGWVCRLQLLLVLTSAVILRSGSRETHDHILLLLNSLTKSLSFISWGDPKGDHHLEQFVYYSVIICILSVARKRAHDLLPSNGGPTLYCVTSEMCLPNRCLPTVICFTI